MREEDLFMNDLLLQKVLGNNLIGIFLLKPVRNNKDKVTDFEISFANKKSGDLFLNKRLRGKRFLKEFPCCRKSVIFEKLRSNSASGEAWSGEYLFEQDGFGLWTGIEIETAGENCLMMIREIPGERFGAWMKEREAQMEALLDNNPSLIFMKDQEGRYVYLNKTYEKHFVHSSNWYGKTDFDFWPKKSAELFRANDDEVLRSGAIQQFIEDSTDNTGKRYCWMNYKFPFTDSNGNKYVGGIGIDATDRIIAEESLRASGKLLREAQLKAEMLIKYAPTGIYELDYSIPKFLSVNDAMCEVSGYSREELLSLSPFQLLDKQSGESFTTRIRKILSGEKVSENVEYKLRLKDGKELWTILKVRIISYGESSRALVIAHDITERKLAEEARHESEERFKTLSETSPVGVGVGSADGLIIYTNPAYESILGYSPGEIIGKKLSDLFWNPEDRKIWASTIKMNGIVRNHEVRLKRKDGTMVWISIDTSPVSFGGKPAIMGIIQDISVKRSFEEELKRNNEILEMRVEERTRSLQKLNEALLKSNRELENFAYITSHDLQEPLRMVTSFTQLLEMKYSSLLDQDAKEYIRFSVEGAKRMYDLINGLLEYSRIGRHEVRFTDVDLNMVIREVKANLKLIIKESQCLIESDELPVVSADRNQMIQLFQNLISNGIKFSDQTPRVTISVEKQNSDYLFSVKDEGIGIEPQYFDKIFEIFKRLHRRDQYPGTGIGLAICKRILENHQGRIWVESEPGKGSVFRFTLRRLNHKGHKV